jgi:hypothetical protein
LLQCNNVERLSSAAWEYVFRLSFERGSRKGSSTPVDAVEADAWLAVICERLYRRQRTGARWQGAAWEQLSRQLSPKAASAAMLERYSELSDAGIPCTNGRH